MSLLEELESRGVTAEDLEKAASVRLFEKAAAAEGVDLDLLDVDQVEDLYATFLSNLPETDSGNTKEASAMNDEIIDLFEKTAAAEGIDLEEMADDELAELYNHYVENVLPEQIAAHEGDTSEKQASSEDQASDEEIVMDMFQKTAAAEGLDLNELNQYELNDMYNYYVENVLPLQLGDKTASAQVEEAQEKLAEAEILGRHMARSYMDEMGKIAAAQEPVSVRDRLTKTASYSQLEVDALLKIASINPEVAMKIAADASDAGDAGDAGSAADDAGKAAKKGISKTIMDAATSKAGKRVALGTVGLGTTAVGGKMLYNRRKRKKAEKAEAMNKESSYDSLVDQAALQILRNAGYDV